MNKSSVSAPAIAGIILITVFSILCLSVFSVLVLSSQNAYSSISDASAESVSAYYDADCAAEATVAAIRRGEMPDGVSKDGSTYSFSCPIDDTRSLEVSISLDDGSFSVLRWQTVSTVKWEYNDSLPVWNGTD